MVYEQDYILRQIEILMQGIRSPQKKLVMLENSPHVCTLGPEREKVFREVIDFVRSVAKES